MPLHQQPPAAPPVPGAHLFDATPEADAPDIQALYARHVQSGTATFETEPPSVVQIAGRMAAVLERRLPYLVARAETGALLGYAYAAPFRERAAYRHSVEDSIYLAPEALGQGLGTRLLAALIARCEAHGDLHQMVAVISDPGGAASVALHHRLGFRTAGTLAQVGHKHGRWLDTIYMQRDLGGGPPEEKRPEEEPPSPL